MKAKALKRVLMWSDGDVQAFDESGEVEELRRNLFQEFLHDLQDRGLIDPGTMVAYRTTSAPDEAELRRSEWPIRHP